MLHLRRVLLGHFAARLAGHFAGHAVKVLLAVVQALGRGGGAALDGPPARHVGLSMGDGGRLGLGDWAARGGLGSELLLGWKFRLHWERRDGWCSCVAGWGGCEGGWDGTGRVSLLKLVLLAGRGLSTLLLLRWLERGG